MFMSASRLIMTRMRHLRQVLTRGKIPASAPVAQWTECRPPEPKRTVRVCPGALFPSRREAVFSYNLSAGTYIWRVRVSAPYGPSAWPLTFSFTTPQRDWRQHKRSRREPAPFVLTIALGLSRITVARPPLPTPPPAPVTSPARSTRPARRPRPPTRPAGER